MPSVTLVAVRRLDKYRVLRQTFGKHLATDVGQTNALADVTAALFDAAFSVDVGQKTKAETIPMPRVSETVDDHRSNACLGRRTKEKRANIHSCNFSRQIQPS